MHAASAAARIPPWTLRRDCAPAMSAPKPVASVIICVGVGHVVGRDRAGIDQPLDTRRPAMPPRPIAHGGAHVVFERVLPRGHPCDFGQGCRPLSNALPSPPCMPVLVGQRHRAPFPPGPARSGKGPSRPARQHPHVGGPRATSARVRLSPDIAGAADHHHALGCGVAGVHGGQIRVVPVRSSLSRVSSMACMTVNARPRGENRCIHRRAAFGGGITGPVHGPETLCP